MMSYLNYSTIMCNPSSRLRYDPQSCCNIASSLMFSDTSMLNALNSNPPAPGYIAPFENETPAQKAAKKIKEITDAFLEVGYERSEAIELTMLMVTMSGNNTILEDQNHEI